MSTKNKAWVELKKAMDSAHGKCYDPETGEGEEPVDPAFCAGCPLLPECFQYGKNDRRAEGVWGGVMWEERQVRPKW